MQQKSSPKSTKPNQPAPVGFLPGVFVTAIAGAALALLTALVYVPLWRAGFIWDDAWSLSYNPLLTDPAGLWKIWTTHGLIPKETHYWPVVYSTFWVEYRRWGLNPLGYHLVNLLFHSLNALLLWRLLLRLGVPGAWLAALLFAVHPAHAESVAWIVELKDLESGFFYLLAFYFFTRFRIPGNANLPIGDGTDINREIGVPRGWYGLALACFILAMLSKSVAITFPLALLVWIWWDTGRLTRKDLLQVAPFLVLAMIIGAADSFMAMTAEKNNYALSILERALLASRAIWFYLRQLFWPVVMPIYPRWKVDATDPRQWIAMLAIPALAACGWFFRRRIGRAPLAAAAFFILTLAPTLGFIAFAYQNTAYVADRFQYLASIGPLTLAAAGAVVLMRRLNATGHEEHRRAIMIAGVAGVMAVTGILGALTWREAGNYRNNETFFRAALAGNPKSGPVYNNLGSALKDQDRWREAEPHFRRALELEPNMVEARNNLIFVLARQGRYREAADELRNRMKYKDPQTPAILLNDVAWGLATCADAAQRDPAAALEFAERANAIERGENPEALDTLAGAYAAGGRFDDAQKAAAEALRLAREKGMTARLVEFEARLNLYRNRQAFISKK